MDSCHCVEGVLEGKFILCKRREECRKVLSKGLIRRSCRLDNWTKWWQYVKGFVCLWETVGTGWSSGLRSDVLVRGSCSSFLNLVASEKIADKQSMYLLFLMRTTPFPLSGFRMAYFSRRVFSILMCLLSSDIFRSSKSRKLQASALIEFLIFCCLM